MNENRISPRGLKQPLPVRIYKNTYLRFALFGAVLALLPLLVSAGIMKSGTLTTVGGVLIYSVAAIGLNLLLGYSGLISLGTAGFMGLGTYVAAYLTTDMGLSFWTAILAAILVCTFIGIHNISKPELWQALAELGIEGWLAEKKASGQIKQKECEDYPREHPRSNPAFHAGLDSQVHGGKQPWATLVGAASGRQSSCRLEILPRRSRANAGGPRPA